MIKNIALFYNKNRDSAEKIAEIVKAKAEAESVELSVDEVNSSTQLAVSVGGDGTVLRTARRVVDYGVPVAPINMGTLGFMGVVADDVEGYFYSLLKGEYDIEERIMLEAETGGHKVTALNDIVVKNGVTSRVVSLELFHQGKNVYSIRGDGVIIATPTGSTAYSLAAGGPVVEPDLELMIITPLNAHALTARPVVVGNVLLEIKCPGQGEEITLTADGQERVKLSSPSAVKVRILDKKFKMVKGKKTFFEVLTEKMNWR